MMNKITFQGTKSVGVIYANSSFAALIEHALGMRGYRVTKGDLVNPWLDGSGRTELTAVKGRLNTEESNQLLFFVADDSAKEAAWRAIRLSYPSAIASKVEKLNRPA
jgi:hypothetical protein